MSEVDSRVIKTFSDYFKKKSVRPETTFKKLGADSLDQIELIMDLEAEFNIELPDAELDKLQSVQDVINLVKKHLP